MVRAQKPAAGISSRPVVYGLILATATIDSLAAVSVALAGRVPMELGIGLLFGSAAGGCLISLTLSPRFLLQLCKPALRKRLWNRSFKLMLLSRFDWPLFIISAHWIGAAGTAIIWGIKPAMTIVFLRQVRGSDGRRHYRPLAGSSWLWLLLAAAGVVLVVTSRPGQVGIGAGWLTALAGGLAGVTSAILAGLAAIRFDWGFGVTRHFAKPEGKRLELPVIIAGITMVGLLSGLILLLLYRLGGGWPAWTNLWPGLLIGMILTAGGWSLATAAWLRTRRLEVGGLFYLTPVLSVCLLLLAGQTGRINPWLFGIGGLLILGSSLALIRADRRGR